MDNKKFNKKIIEIWEREEYRSKRGDYWPILFPEFKKEAILFVGLNPSLSNNKIPQTVKDAFGDNFNPMKVWKISQKKIGKKLTKNIIELEKKYREGYNYFKRFEEISKHLSPINWDSIDLFFYRQTKQKNFKKLFIKNGKADGKFAKEQIELSLQMIEEIKPKIIIVCNALASALIQKRSKEKIKFHEEQGFHLITLKDCSVPIFFSSTLSGQGALDKGSYERLKWHAKKAIEWKAKKTN